MIDRALLDAILGRPLRLDRTTVSLYLDVDGRHRPRASDVTTAAGALLRQARAAGAEAEARHLQQALDGLDRSAARGIAAFADADGLVAIRACDRPFVDEVTVGPAPELRPLLSQDASIGRVLVALVDHASSRLLRFEHGAIAAETTLQDPPPRHVDDDDGGGRAGGFQAQLDEAAARHLRRTADALVAEAARHGLDELLLGGPVPALAEFRRLLPGRLADGLLGEVGVRVGAPNQEIETKVRAALDEVQTLRRDATVAAFRARVGADTADVGIEPTLRALQEGRAESLFIGRRFATAGSYCAACDLVGQAAPRCPACGRETTALDDVAPLLVRAALARHARVVVVDDFGTVEAIGVETRF